MLQSIRQLADDYDYLGYLKKEKRRFYGSQMLNFARERKENYKLLKKGDDYLISDNRKPKFIKDFFEYLECN